MANRGGILCVPCLILAKKYPTHAESLACFLALVGIVSYLSELDVGFNILISIALVLPFIVGIKLANTYCACCKDGKAQEDKLYDKLHKIEKSILDAEVQMAEATVMKNEIAREAALQKITQLKKDLRIEMSIVKEKELHSKQSISDGQQGLRNHDFKRFQDLEIATNYISTDAGTTKVSKSEASILFGKSANGMALRENQLKQRTYLILVPEDDCYEHTFSGAALYRKNKSNKYALSIINELRAIHSWKHVKLLPDDNDNFAFYRKWAIDGENCHDFEIMHVQDQILIRNHFGLCRDIMHAIERKMKRFDEVTNNSSPNFLIQKIHSLCKFINALNNTIEMKDIGLEINYINFGKFGEGLVFHLLPWNVEGKANKHWHGSLPNIKISIIRKDDDGDDNVSMRSLHY